MGTLQFDVLHLQVTLMNWLSDLKKKLLLANQEQRLATLFRLPAFLFGQ